jgi:O-antigen ligase
MIIEKPLFGYGPDKNYFYTNNLYSESEYVLITWRYGFIGFFAYLTFLLYPLYTRIKDNVQNYLPLLLFTIAIFLTAITNNPISFPPILILYAYIAGVFIKRKNTTQKNLAE